MTDTDLALLIDRFMRRIYVGLHAKAPEFDTERIGPGGAMVLLTIDDLGGAGMHELARRIARDKSQMTRVIRSLETKGVVERRPSPCDARVTMIALTKKGAAVVETLKAVLTDVIDEIIEPLTVHEKTALKNLMRRAIA